MQQVPNSLPRRLRRELNTGDAILLGLGSIVGTGVFVSLALASSVAGVWVLPAVLLAALLALCNGLSSAALAAVQPVSGGTYEYAYRWLSPAAGFSAGWLFLLAKSASAATAALGSAGYLLALLGGPPGWRVPLALALACIITLLLLAGIRRSAQANTITLSLSLLALLAFVACSLPLLPENATQHIAPLWNGGAVFSLPALLEAAALLFVAYTGYGRIATLGEEVLEPQRSIPRAIVTTLLLSALLYIAVTLAALTVAGPLSFGGFAANFGAPLIQTAELLNQGWLPPLLTLGACAAMLGVLLNLLLGLSRVVLAMGRRGDLPSALANLGTKSKTPAAAVLCCAALIAVLIGVGSVKLAWSFSAFTVLIYYALTNLAALRLPPEQRLSSPLVAWLGLLGCLGLAGFVELRVWLAGLSLLLIGLLWHWLRAPSRAAAAKQP